MKGDPNVLFLALELFIDIVVVGGLVAVTKRLFPKFSPTLAKIIAGAVFVGILFVFYVYGPPSPVMLGDRIVYLLPHLAISLWAMLVLHFILRAQDNERKIKEVDAQVATLSRLQVALTDLLRKSIESEVGLCKSQLEGKIQEKEFALSDQIAGQKRIVDENRASSDNRFRAIGEIIEAFEETRKSCEQLWKLVRTDRESIFGHRRIDDESQRGVGIPKYHSLASLGDDLKDLRRELRNKGIPIAPTDDD